MKDSSDVLYLLISKIKQRISKAGIAFIRIYHKYYRIDEIFIKNTIQHLIITHSVN